MGDVISREEKFARKRASKEVVNLRFVNSYVNSHKQEAVAAGMTSAKTMQHGVDLCVAIAKARKLNAQYKFAAARFEWAVVQEVAAKEERWAVLLVRHPDGVYVLGPDDEVPLLSDYPHKVIEMTVDSMLGRWEVIDEQPAAS